MGWDVIVIGGGAAGLMAAGVAARNGRKTLLLEKMEKPARKVRITGKGRCNVTNTRPRGEFFDHIHVNREFFAPSFDRLSNTDTVSFFESLGVPLVTERGGRVFPASGKAWDVADALVRWCTAAGATIECNARVERLETAGGDITGVSVERKNGRKETITAPNVILATGGASYPLTGSTGDGYRLAYDAGHEIEAVRPSLVALESPLAASGRLNELKLLNVNVRLEVDGAPVGEAFGEVEFISSTVAGAVTLRLSRRAVDALIDGRKTELALDLKPSLSEEKLRNRIARELESMPSQSPASSLIRKLVPAPLVGPVAAAAAIDSKTALADREKLIGALKNFRIPISDYRPFEEAIVTAGGVRCSEVDPATLQSRIVRGLYFAGEVLDLDAATGGYNLQIAFSTGALAGELKG